MRRKRPEEQADDFDHVDDEHRARLRADFEDDFNRYLPPISDKTPFQSATPLQVNAVNELASNLTATPGFSVANENEPNALKSNGCSGVADRNPRPGQEGDRNCAQCRGPVDGKERQVATGHKIVWLHPECERFYLEVESLP
jgi:hypothetical protein